MIYEITISTIFHYIDNFSFNLLYQCFSCLSDQSYTVKIREWLFCGSAGQGCYLWVEVRCLKVAGQHLRVYNTLQATFQPLFNMETHITIKGLIATTKNFGWLGGHLSGSRTIKNVLVKERTHCVISHQYYLTELKRLSRILLLVSFQQLISSLFEISEFNSCCKLRPS